jgi:hypothetical protein
VKFGADLAAVAFNITRIQPAKRATECVAHGRSRGKSWEIR